MALRRRTSKRESGPTASAGGGPSEFELRSFRDRTGERWINVEDLLRDLRSPRHDDYGALRAYAALLADYQQRLDTELGPHSERRKEA